MQPAVFSPHAAVILRAHQFQGATNDCGPYCTAILLQAFSGKNITGSAIAALLNRSPRGRRLPHNATLPWGIVDLFHQAGLEAGWQIFTPAQKLHQSLVDGKRIFIPIIGGWRPLWAHYLIALAFNPMLGWGFANPAHPAKELAWRSSEHFYKEWMRVARLAVWVTPPQSGTITFEPTALT